MFAHSFTFCISCAQQSRKLPTNTAKLLSPFTLFALFRLSDTSRRIAAVLHHESTPRYACQCARHGRRCFRRRSTYGYAGTDERRLTLSWQDQNIIDNAETVYISSLALLKMLRHGRAGVPMEVMGLMLGEFVDDYTVRVVDVFAMPQSGTGVSVEAVDPVFQTKMMDMLRQTGRSVQTLGNTGCLHRLTVFTDQKRWLAGIIHILDSGAGYRALTSTHNSPSNS